MQDEEKNKIDDSSSNSFYSLQPNKKKQDINDLKKIMSDDVFLTKKKNKKTNLKHIFSFKHTEEYHDRVYTQSKMDKIRLHASSVFFAGMYDEKRITMRYLVAFFSAIIYSIIVFFLVDITGLYSSGTSGLFQGIARLIGTVIALHGASMNLSNDVYQGLFWGIWFLANIPLILFAWFKIGKRFTKLTLVFVFTATVMGLLLSIPIFINPSIKYSFFFLGNPLTMNNMLNHYNVYVLSWNYYPEGSIIHSLPLSSPLNGSVNSLQQFYALSNEDWIHIEKLRDAAGYDDLPRVLSLAGYTVLLTLLYPPVISVNYIIGGSTGGMDIPSIYLSDKKKKQLGHTLIMLNTSSMIIGIILGSYVSGGLGVSDHWTAQYFFSPNLILCLIYSIIGYLWVNKYFPKFAQSNLKVFTDKPHDIVKKMKDLHYPYQLNAYKTIRVVSDKEYEQYVLETVVRYIELPKIIHEIRKVDPGALLTINMLRGIDGELLVNKGID